MDHPSYVANYNKTTADNRAIFTFINCDNRNFRNTAHYA